MTKTDASRVHFLYAARWVGVLLIVLWVALFGLRAHQATAATSNTINFQARLMQSSGAIVPDGTYNVEFKLYNALTSSGSSQGSCTGDTACLWTETRTSGNRITVVNGYLTAELGSVTSLPSIDWSQNLYLTMNIGGTSGSPSWDGEMSPRLHLTAVPHAFSADKLTATNGSNTSTLSFTAPTASRSILLPDEAGTLCIQSSSNCGFAAGSGSTSYIQNQNSSDQTANFRISGSGQATTSFLAPLFDTASAVTLNIGTTNATAINLNKSTAITGGISQSGGTISLVGNAASSITTSTGALTLTAAGTSNWTVGGTNQSLTITTSGTGVLTLGTTGAGTVTMGSSSQTINIGATNNTRAVHIADGGSSTNQVVTMGSTNTGSTTTIQGGTTSTAINLATGTNGKINLTAAGTGGIVGTLGSSGFSMKTTTDSSTALAVQASNNDYIFSVSTTTGVVTMGAIQATYSGFDGTLNTPLGNLTLGSTTNATTIKGSSSMTLQATSGSFATTVGFTAPTANRTVTIADESGTICLRTSTNCGFAASSGSANYIQNGVTAQSANMYVQAATSGTVAGVLRANAAGAGDILDLKNGAGTNVATFSSTGAVLLQNSTNSATAFQIQNAAGSAIFNVNTSTGLMTNTGSLRLNVGSSTADTFTTPLGASVPTAINIPLYNPGAFGQLLAFGLTSAAPDSARAISVFDARTSGTIQPAIAVFSPNENDLFGLSWNGLNTVASLETASAAIALRPGGSNVKLWAGSTGVAIGSNVSSAAYPLDVTGDVNTSTQYRIAGTVICTSTGCTPAAGSANYIQNGVTAQSANMYVQAATSGSVAATLRANAAGAGDILDLKNGAGTNVATFSSTGSTLFKTSTDATTAFQVQSNGGTTALNVDTTNSRVGIGGVVAPEVTLDVSGAIQQTGMQTSDTGAADNNKWTKLGTCSITAQYQQCLTTLNILGGHDGSAGNNTQATVSVRVKQQNAMGGAPYVNVNLNDTAEVITKADIVAVTTTNTGVSTVVDLYARITNTFEHWAYTPLINNGNGATSTWDWSPANGFVAALPGGTQNVARYGNLNANLMTVEATSTATMTIQNAGGANKLFVADTTNLRIAVNQATAAYTLDVAGDINSTTALRIAGTVVCDTTGAVGCTAKSGSGYYIHNQATVQSSNMYIQSATSGTATAVLQANATSGNILNLVSGGGTTIGTVSNSGAMNLQNSTNSTAAFQVQTSVGAGGNSVLRVDTSTERVAIGVISDPISAKLNIATSSTVALRAYQGGSSDAFQLGNASADFLTIGSTGNLLLKPTTNSASAFAIQTSTGGNTFSTGTSGGLTLFGPSWSGLHTGIDLSTNDALLEVGSTDGSAVGIRQINGGQGKILHSTDLVIQRESGTSATDFMVQDASGSTIMAVDSTSAPKVTIGTADTTGTLLVLDTKTDAADPTGTDGAMYYNSNSKNFRCYNGGGWQNCIGGLMYSNTAASTAVNTCTTACAAFSTAAAVPANYCQPGRVIHIVANGTYSNSGTASTLAFGLFYGTDASVRGNDTQIGTTSAALATLLSASNVGWGVDFYINCFSTTSMNGQGTAWVSTTTSAQTFSRMYTATSTTVTSTSAKNLYLFPTWGASNASNSVTVQQFIVTGM